MGFRCDSDVDLVSIEWCFRLEFRRGFRFRLNNQNIACNLKLNLKEDLDLDSDWIKTLIYITVSTGFQ